MNHAHSPAPAPAGAPEFSEDTEKALSILGSCAVCAIAACLLLYGANKAPAACKMDTIAKVAGQSSRGVEVVTSRGQEAIAKLGSKPGDAICLH